MIHSGLVSVTFRKLSPEEIVSLVSKAGLEAIEWGGDIHVPHGQVDRAKDVRKMTEDAGIKMPSYGSYYSVGHEEESVSFQAVLDSAVELGVQTIRVWAGKKGSKEADADYRKIIVEDSQRIARLASEAGIGIAYEYHSNTLTDTHESAVRLLKDVAADNVGTYWQPPEKLNLEQCLEGLEAVLPWLVNVHVYNEDDETEELLPLAGGEDRWMRYLKVIASTGREHFAMLEFVRGNSPDAFLEDAKVLKDWLSRLD